MYLSNLELGDHLYWNIGKFLPAVHGEPLLVLWFASTLILVSLLYSPTPIIETRDTILRTTIAGATREISKAALGENEYRPWAGLCLTLGAIIATTNLSGALIPWGLVNPQNYKGDLGYLSTKIEIGWGDALGYAIQTTLSSVLGASALELKAPATDPNFTLGLATLTSLAYLYAGLTYDPVKFLSRYVSPISAIEDVTKPLSLGFRLFGNVLADEIIVAVLILIYPLFLPIPLMLNGLFAGTIQALVFPGLSCAYIAEVLE